ncbi:MAG TPA: hypothetical protein VEU32_11685 [Burkholderiales bacterium]|nr:hypothetical protein [Burkholderiales bacterium]
MKNRELRLMSYPTTAELYALERAARAERTAQMARLLRAAVSDVRKLFSAPKGLRHA